MRILATPGVLVLPAVLFGCSDDDGAPNGSLDGGIEAGVPIDAGGGDAEKIFCSDWWKVSKPILATLEALPDQCVADTDCTLVFPPTRCLSSCGDAYRADQADAAFQIMGESLSPACARFSRAGCYVLAPIVDCKPQIPVCRDSHCAVQASQVDTVPR